MNAARAFRRLGIAAALLSAAALAQPGADPLSALLDCAAIDDDGRRLECFDRAAADARERALRALDRDARQRTGASREAPASDESVRTVDSVIDLGTRPREARAAESRSAPRGERIVTIVEVRTNVPGRAVFITSEGAELVQTSGSSRPYLPDVPFEATLRPGAIGGTFLVPADTRGGIRVSERNRRGR